MQFASTPREISKPVDKLCRELVTDPRPEFVQITPEVGAEINDCFPVVERQVREYGGSICYGWQIWEWPEIMVEAEFHALWSDGSGKLHDLTPKPIPVQQILFLPDPVRVYEGRQVNNVRRAISSAPEVREFIRAADAEFELMNRGERAQQHGQIGLQDSEAEEMLLIQRRKSEAYARIIGRLPKPGRNDPCPCGSGRKFKKCHGQ